MKLLALDQSSHITGYSIFEDGKLVTFGKFDAERTPGATVGERLKFIRDKVQLLITENEITEVVLEDIQMQGNIANNVQTFKILAEVFGVISELLVEMNIPQSAVMSTSWKSALGIRGRARAEQKRNAQAYVTITYGVKATQDESDAICIGAYRSNNSPDPGRSWSN